MDQALKKEDIPAGGIADFVMTDEQIELLEAEELKEQYGTSGIAQFSDVGKKMANFGRYGDDTVAHVETGELIVPRALIDRSPALKESIFQHLRELGVEDPERYVVGSQENSINPTTGLPEFFLKKLFKKVTRGVSKIAKGVGKALKKAAPVILPLVLAATPLGPVYGAALGSGIGTLISGGSPEDALRNAFIAGASGAVYSGISGGTEGISQAFADPAGRFGQTAAGIGQGNFFGSYQAPTTNLASRPIGSIDKVSDSILNKPSLGEDGRLYQVNADGRVVDLGRPDDGIIQVAKKTTEKDVLSNLGSKTGSNVALDPSKGINSSLSASVDRVGPIESLKQGEYFDAFTGGPKVSAADVARANNIDITKLKTTDALYQELVKKAAELSPGFMGTYGPSLALAGTVGAATGFFDAPEEEELERGRTGLDVYQEDPDKFKVKDVAIREPEGPFTRKTPYDFDYNPYIFPKNPFAPPVFTQNVAQGGEIFPRRTGGIMPDEGIPNEDSVRAMLMPGEFVMTTDAVKGLGNGNLNKGINNMYSVMRNLEQRGRAMA